MILQLSAILPLPAAPGQQLVEADDVVTHLDLLGAQPVEADVRLIPAPRAALGPRHLLGHRGVPAALRDIPPPGGGGVLKTRLELGSAAIAVIVLLGQVIESWIEVMMMMVNDGRVK